MKQIFKKNQIIITTLAVMIAIAGYLNYSGKLFGETKSGTEETNADMANKELLDISEDDLDFLRSLLPDIENDGIREDLEDFLNRCE